VRFNETQLQEIAKEKKSTEEYQYKVYIRNSRKKDERAMSINKRGKSFLYTILCL